MSYLSQNLIFTESKIYFVKDGIEYEVMMDWEDIIMYNYAKYVTNEGKAESILEIGFGMGISAEYIQSYKPTSHTIIEIHPQILERAKNWAKDREGVTILEGDWYDLVREGKLGKYDGVFLDTYFDKNIDKFKNYYSELVNKGGRMTWWNPTEDKLPSEDLRSKSNVEYEEIIINQPIPHNTYHNTSVYWMPKLQF